jgi:hypothetical protein
VSLSPDENWRGSFGVDAKPAEMQMQCGERLDTPAAYEIDDVAFDLSEGTIIFRAGWPEGIPDGSHPSANLCIAAPIRDGSVVVAYPFSLFQGFERGDTLTAVPGRPLHPADAEAAEPVVVCQPFGDDIDDFMQRFLAGYET